MWVKIYIALSSEMCINLQLKKHFNQLYQIRYISTEINVADSRLGENDLVFTKRLQMTNKIIGYSYARTIMNCIEIYSEL